MPNNLTTDVDLRPLATPICHNAVSVSSSSRRRFPSGVFRICILQRVRSVEAQDTLIDVVRNVVEHPIEEVPDRAARRIREQKVAEHFYKVTPVPVIVLIIDKAKSVQNVTTRLSLGAAHDAFGPARGQTLQSKLSRRSSWRRASFAATPITSCPLELFELLGAATVPK